MAGEDNEDKLQDVKIQSLKDFFSEKFNHMNENISRLDGKFSMFEDKNCRKHDMILSEMRDMEVEIIGKKVFADFLKKYEDTMDSISKRFVKLENKQDKIGWYFSAMTVPLYLIANYIFDIIFKKQL